MIFRRPAIGRAAVAMIAVIVVLVGLLAFTTTVSPQTITHTVTTTSTQTTVVQTSTTTLPAQSVTTTVTTTATQNTTVTSNRFELVFRQVTPCPNLGFFASWSVTLSDGESVTALNANFSQCCSAAPNNPSIITFLVANGNYSFSVTPSNRFTPSAGTVTVDNQEVVINLDVFMSSCGSTTTG